MIPHDTYRVQVEYNSPGNWVGSQQHATGGGTITLRVQREKATAISAVVCPTHVVAGSTWMKCNVASTDRHQNKHADPLSFIAVNVTFASVVGGVVQPSQPVQSSVQQTSAAWNIKLPSIPTQQGSLRIVYYVDAAQTTTAQVDVSVVHPSAVASNSLLECPTTTVAGTSLTCTVSLKNATGLKVMDTPAGGADSSAVDMPALTFQVTDGGSSSSNGTTFTTSAIGVAVYSASTQLNTAGKFTITSYFATHAINGGSSIRTIDVVPSIPLASTVTVVCPSLEAGTPASNTACFIHMTDAQGNPAGNGANVAAFHATVVDSMGRSLQTTIVHDVSKRPLGTYGVQFAPTHSGTSSVAVR